MAACAEDRAGQVALALTGALAAQFVMTGKYQMLAPAFVPLDLRVV